MKKKIIFSFLLCGILIALVLNYQTILIGAGRYLAPEGNGEADIVIIEGGELVKEKAVEVGLVLLAANKVKGIAIVTKQNGEDGGNGEREKEQVLILSPVLHPSSFPLKLLFGIEGLND